MWVMIWLLTRFRYIYTVVRYSGRGHVSHFQLVTRYAGIDITNMEYEVKKYISIAVAGNAVSDS